jgi:hypothetical protein
MNPHEILEQCIQANGGQAWQQPKTLQLKGNAVFTPFGKTDDDHKIVLDTYNLYRIFPAENNAAREANGSIRFTAKANDYLYMHLIYDGQTTHNFLSDKAKPYNKYFSWTNNFGFSIIRFAQNPGFKTELLVNDQVEGFECYVIKIIDPKQFETHFFIDSNNYFIRSVAFVTELGYHHRIYSNFYKADAGAGNYFNQPGRLRVYFEGVKWIDVNWESTLVNEPIDELIFKEQLAEN